MEFDKLNRGRALYVQDDRIWVAKGMSFFAVDFNGKRVTKKYSVGSPLEKLLSYFRLSRQLLRQGLHHLVPLNNGSILVTAKKKTYILNQNGETVNIFTGYTGNKPAHQGICVTDDGMVFFGEYSVNLDHKNSTKIYRSKDNGMSFECILDFGNKIRHSHFLKYDSYEKCLWLGTGDEDSECFLMRSDDNGDTWTTVGQGSQMWRAVGICFDKDYVIWGTDAGSVPDQNYLIRMDRKTHEIQRVSALEGPTHGCASLKDERLFVATGVEGGENEKDNYARIKMVQGDKATTVFKLKKDIFPLILQYGVYHFPYATENTDRLIVTTLGLKGYGEVVLIEHK